MYTAPITNVKADKIPIHTLKSKTALIKRNSPMNPAVIGTDNEINKKTPEK